uniref:Uncharacterized protein n=1 Tax=Setaria digitata TaxID=48799 RepID=A0A915PLK1_9BILA
MIFVGDKSEEKNEGNSCLARIIEQPSQLVATYSHGNHRTAISPVECGGTPDTMVQLVRVFHCAMCSQDEEKKQLRKTEAVTPLCGSGSCGGVT